MDIPKTNLPPSPFFLIGKIDVDSLYLSNIKTTFFFLDIFFFVEFSIFPNRHFSCFYATIINNFALTLTLCCQKMFTF